MTHRSWAALAIALVVCLPLSAQDEPSLDPAEGLLPPPQTHFTHQGTAGRGGGPVTAEMLKKGTADPASWLHFGGNYESWRHSPIEVLTPASLENLRVAWMLQTGVPVQLEVSPIVYDGILYATSSHNRLFALDAMTGKILWRYDHQQPKDLRICCGPVNRGPAIAGDYVLMATLDARLIAFDRKTGEIAWNTEIAPYAGGLSATAAPLVVGDVAVIGVGGGEYGVRGFFDGYDVKTGERKWRHYTIPAAGEPGVETWAGDSYKSGGGSTWVSGSYDPSTDTLLWGVGNPSPDWNGDLRQGDNLFTDSVLALDPRTGKRKWHFQFTPHDLWDYDGNTELLVVDITHDGQKVPAVVQANRNGYFYALDRRDGKFLFAKKYADQVNWATAIDPKGRPVFDPRFTPADEGEEPTRVCPGLAGGKNGAYNGAYNPDLGLAFMPVIESCMQFKKGLIVFLEGVPFLGGEPIGVDATEGKAYGHLSAIDVATGAVKWRYKDPYPMMAGVLSTGGGAVITGNMEGFILGFDGATGKETWRWNAGSTIRSHPIAYQIDGRTFVAVGVGGGGGVEVIVGKPSIVPDAGTLVVFELAGDGD